MAKCKKIVKSVIKWIFTKCTALFVTDDAGATTILWCFEGACSNEFWVFPVGQKLEDATCTMQCVKKHFLQHTHVIGWTMEGDQNPEETITSKAWRGKLGGGKLWLIIFFLKSRSYEVQFPVNSALKDPCTIKWWKEKENGGAWLVLCSRQKDTFLVLLQSQENNQNKEKSPLFYF